MKAYLDRMINEKKAVRRTLVLWSLLVASYAIYQFFENYIVFRTEHNLVIGAILLFATMVFRDYFAARKDAE